jgi:hypothetical protein
MFGRGSNAFSRAQAHVKTADEMRLAWCLEHDPEKWKPVFRKDHAQTKR